MRRPGALAHVCLLLLVWASLAVPLPPLRLAASSAAAALPSRFSDQLVADVASPVALAFTPDGRLLIASQLGKLHVYRNGALRGTPALDLGARLCTNSERGLLGIAVDPAFATNHYVYLFYTFN